MKIIIGLGNPGKQYEKTRHNVGFMMLDKIRENYKFPDFNIEKDYNAEISRDKVKLLQDKDVMLVKPQTFMNNSGSSVRAILDFYKLTPNDITVIHDDIDLPLGEYKIATQSGSAGHNGVQDIIDKIGTKEFLRIRIGIANDKLKNPIDPADFVLQNFSDEELKAIENISNSILEEIKKLI